MIKINYSCNGRAGLVELPYRVKTDVTRAIEEALIEEAKEWKQLVISSTWLNPIPSPTSMIITRKYRDGNGDWRLEYGWLHYKGDVARAEWRALLRIIQFDPASHERIMARLQRLGGE